MEQRALGRSGLVVSRLGLGTMTWGLGTGEDDAAAQLVAYRDAGGTLLDTADSYGAGVSEEIIGRLLQDVVPRGEVTLATKACGRTGPGPMGKGSSRGHLLAALDASLERLRTDHVDLWQVHFWDPAVPLAETLATLDHAVSSGRARYVGVSNYCGWQTAAAATWQAAWPGRAPLVSNQVEYSLVERGVEGEVMPACGHAGIGLLPWSPLGRGVLTGKYRRGSPADSRAASPVFGEFVGAHLSERAGRIVEAVATAADGLGTSPLAVALSWVRDRPGVVAPIVGARTVGQLAGSLATENTILPVEIIKALDDVSVPPTGYPRSRAGLTYPVLA
jgi:aryl-alcohol dehydrogenase-like predicted oxidoreductase